MENPLLLSEDELLHFLFFSKSTCAESCFVKHVMAISPIYCGESFEPSSLIFLNDIGGSLIVFVAPNPL